MQPGTKVKLVKPDPDHTGVCCAIPPVGIVGWVSTAEAPPAKSCVNFQATDLGYETDDEDGDLISLFIRTECLEEISLDEADLLALHNRCDNHREDFEEVETCGCFYCQQTFAPDQIREWIDGDQTALCPKCGIDSVLAGPQTAETLAAMHVRWFGRAGYAKK